MKITKLELCVLPKETSALVTTFDGLVEDTGPAGRIQYSLLRILTDGDLEGDYIVWSETAAGRPTALAEVLKAMKSAIVGRDPFDREAIWQELSALWYGQRGPALAAVDIALWDLAGKAAALPIFRLLGARRNKVRAYASGNVTHKEAEIRRIAADLKKRGYTAMKLHPIPIEFCAGLREVVGNEIDLIYDAVFAHSRHEAIRVGRELERLSYRWYEAPFPPDDVEGYAMLSSKLDIPLTVELPHPSQYREYVKRGAVDYLRTLSGISGGITEMRKVAALCEAFGMNWEPHAYGGTHYQAANLHAILSVDNCEFFELPIEQGIEGHFDVGTKEVIRIDDEGFVHGPEKPGLGLELDWDLVEQGTTIEI